MSKDKFADYDLIDIKNKQQPESALLSDALAIVLRHKFLFIFFVTVSLVLGYVYIRTTPRMFMRTATVMIKDAKKGTGLMESQTFKEVLSANTNSIENETGIFKSRRLMYKVAQKLNLNVSYRALNFKKTELYKNSPIRVHFMGDEKECSMIVKPIDFNWVELSEMSGGNDSEKTIKVRTGDIIETPVGKVIIEVDSIEMVKYSDMGILVNRSNLKSIANSFSHKLNAEVNVAQSSLLKLTLIDENTMRAEDILNTLIEVYNEDALDDKNRVTVNAANFIDERLSIIEKELGAVDSQIEEYKKQNRLTNITLESDVFLNNSNRLNNEGLNIENQMNIAEYMRGYLVRNNKNGDMIPASIGIDDDGIQAIIIDYNSKVEKRNKLVANSSERNPVVMGIDETLKEQRRSLIKAIDGLIASLKLQIASATDKEAETFLKIANLPTQQKHIVSIERQQKTKEELYLYLLNKKEENELQQIIAESNCKVVDSADGPSSPVAPNKIQIILICLIAGFSIPSLWLYLKMLLDTKVYFKEDVKDKLTIPFLGELPFDNVKEDRDIRISDNSAHEHLNEALRIVRENLNFMNGERSREGKAIQLISFNPSSGKTFITINLAANIALSNARVIALDLDLRKASLSRRLGLSTKNIGISNYLSGGVDDIPSLIHNIPTNHKSFDVISSGPIPPNPSELLKDSRLDNLIVFLKKNYDYVLFDNPPYGMVVDAFVCSRLADHSIYVIRAGLFDKRLFPDLQELYDSNKIKDLSIILNGVDYRKIAYNYRYSYGYHYHRYGKQSKSQKGWKRFWYRLFGNR